MMTFRSSALLAILLAFATTTTACGRDRKGDDDDDDDDGGIHPSDAGDVDGSAEVDGSSGELVPDPGDAVGGEWTDIEPNDDPSHAVPVGVLAGPVWAGFVEPFTQIASADDTDFFVFRTGEEATLGDVYIALCGTANTMDGYLSQVVDGRMGAELASAAGPDTGCITLVDFGQGPEILAATTAYVLEVRAQPDADPGDFPVLYSA
jgi:hypothetical protein